MPPFEPDNVIQYKTSVPYGRYSKIVQMSARRLVQVYLATNPGAHLRDGLIVDKVGIGATREPLYSPDSKSTQNGSRQKNKPRIRGVFFNPKYDHKFTTKSPQSHHKFTIKKPRFTTLLPQKTPAKTQKLAATINFIVTTSFWFG